MTGCYIGLNRGCRVAETLSYAPVDLGAEADALQSELKAQWLNHDGAPLFPNADTAPSRADLVAEVEELREEAGDLKDQVRKLLATVKREEARAADLDLTNKRIVVWASDVERQNGALTEALAAAEGRNRAFLDFVREILSAHNYRSHRLPDAYVARARNLIPKDAAE